MTTVTIDLPDTVFSALRLALNEFVREMRIAAAVQWYAQEKVGVVVAIRVHAHAPMNTVFSPSV